MSWLAFQLRWWKWFLTGPSVLRMHLTGLDKQSQDVLFERWFSREPKPD